MAAIVSFHFSVPQCSYHLSVVSFLFDSNTASDLTIFMENMAHRVCFCTLFPSARDADEREKWIHALEGTILRHTLQLRVCSKPPCLYAYGCVLTSKINTGVGILDVPLPVSTSVCSLKEMKLEDERKCEF